MVPKPNLTGENICFESKVAEEIILVILNNYRWSMNLPGTYFGQHMEAICTKETVNRSYKLYKDKEMVSITIILITGYKIQLMRFVIGRKSVLNLSESITL